jgi:hypothetical protein
MPNSVRPYLLPSADAITFGKWQLFDADSHTSLPDVLTDWDPGMELRLSREVAVDLELICASTLLGEGASFALTVSWTSSGIAMKDSAPPVLVDRSGPIELNVSLPAERLTGVVTLRTTMTLVNSAASPKPGIAQTPGAILAEDYDRLSLHDESGFFPVHQIDFAGSRLDPNASWHLETTTDLNAPFLGSFLLLLNQRDTELATAVARGGPKNQRQQLLVDDLEHGVAALLLELAALHDVELAEREIWPEGTVGDALTRVLEQGRRSGAVPAPTGPHDLALSRTRIDGTIRASGRGRQLR